MRSNGCNYQESGTNMRELYDSENNKKVQVIIKALKSAYLFILALNLGNT